MVYIHITPSSHYLLHHIPKTYHKYKIVFVAQLKTVYILTCDRIYSFLDDGYFRRS